MYCKLGFYVIGSTVNMIPRWLYNRIFQNINLLWIPSVLLYNPCMINDFVKSIKSLPLKNCRKTSMTDVNTKQLISAHINTNVNEETAFNLRNKLCSVYPNFWTHFIYYDDNDKDHIRLFHTCTPFARIIILRPKWGEI